MADNNVEVLGLDPKASVVEIFNQHNQTRLRNDDALLKPGELDEDSASGTLSVRRKQSVFDQLDYAGKADINWRRLDLGAFFYFDLEVPIQLPATTIELLIELERRTGLKIHPEDVVLEQIPDEEIASNYVLKARADSLRWYGQVPINCGHLIKLQSKIPVGTNLGDLGAELDPEGWVIDLGGDLNGNLFAPLFKETAVGTRLTDSTPELVNAFQSIMLNLASYTRWSFRGAVVANNLYNAQVTYNDVAPGHIPGHYNQTLTHAIRILLDPAFCNTPFGIVTIYYNPDFTPGTE